MEAFPPAKTTLTSTLGACSPGAGRGSGHKPLLQGNHHSPKCSRVLAWWLHRRRVLVYATECVDMSTLNEMATVMQGHRNYAPCRETSHPASPVSQPEKARLSGRPEQLIAKHGPPKHLVTRIVFKHDFIHGRFHNLLDYKPIGPSQVKECQILFK